MPKTKKVQTPGAMLKTIIARNALTTKTLAQELDVTTASLNLIVQEKGRVSVPLSFRLSKFFNTEPEYWLVAQMKSDIAIAEEDKDLEKSLKSIVPLPKKGKK